VRQISDRVAVMYLARDDAEGGTRAALTDPPHAPPATPRPPRPGAPPPAAPARPPPLVGHAPRPARPAGGPLPRPGRPAPRGRRGEVRTDPLQPYTAGLRAAVPVPDPTVAQPLTPTVVGEVPDPVRPPAGCPFHPRCPVAEDVCRAELPPLAEIRTGRRAACHVAARSEAVR